VHGPGARFLRADGEESQQMEQFITCADDPGEAGFMQAHFLQENQPVFGVHAYQFGLDGG